MRLLALIIKEFRQVRRDSSSILLAFVLPIIMLMLFGLCVNYDTSVTKLALVTEDEAPTAHRFLEHLQGSPYFRVDRVDDEDAAMEQLRSGEIHAVLIIPSDFSRAVEARGETRLLLATDGSMPNTAQFTSLYLQSICGTWLREQISARGSTGIAAIEVIPLYRFNSAAISRRYILPGSIAVVLSFVGTFLTAMVVAREWERGTMELLLASPMSRFEFILSKLIPYFLLGLGAMCVCTLAATLLFGVPLRAPVWLLLGITSIFLLSVLALGLLISTLLRNQYSASLVSLNVSVLPTIMLSGFIFELSSTPGWVQAISYLIPARYFSPSLSTLFLAGAEWAALLLNVLLLVISAFFWLGLVYIATPRRLDI